MKTYLVGGALRDRLLGRPVSDHDWLVVGATPEEMVSRGYLPVGRDFPVFLHPRTREEYALARTERKSAPGYRGFTVHASPDVTLEQDLARRDLTVNAIAMPAEFVQADGSFEPDPGKLADPFHGRRDLQQRLLRHVTDAFREDPVRILRVARFAARFDDFSVAPETMALMREMVEAGETDALVAERVWQELARGLMEARPSRMFEVLRACGALAVLLPEVDRLWGVPQSAEHHPEVDTGVHLMMVVDTSARLEAPLPVRFAFDDLLGERRHAVHHANGFLLQRGDARVIGRDVGWERVDRRAAATAALCGCRRSDEREGAKADGCGFPAARGRQGADG